MVISPGRSEALDTAPHTVFPITILIGEEFLVDLPYRFKDVSGGLGVERHGQRLGEIPSDCKLSIPQEVLADRDGQFNINIGLISGLLFIVVTRNVGIERYGSGKPVDFPFAEELHVLVLLVNQFLERSERLGIGGPVILEASAIVIGILIDVVRISDMSLAKRVTESEVGRIPRHGVLALDIKFQTRNAEVAHSVPSDRIGIDRVLLFLRVASVDSVLQKHVLIQRIVLRSGFLITIRVIDRSVQFDLLGKESAHIGLYRHIILVIIVKATLTESLINRAKAGSFLVHAHINGSNVAHVKAQTCLGCPSTVLVKVGDTQLIDPNGAILS